VRVLAFVPSEPPVAWDPDAVPALRRALPAATVLDDRDGAFAARLGARTSGHVLLYDARGRLVFSGGITAGRGHFGANASSRSLAAGLGDGSAAGAAARTPVFGCPLNADEPPRDERCCPPSRPSR
jgi:hypothetical protein